MNAIASPVPAWGPLTYEPAKPDSPVAAYFKQRFPHVKASSSVSATAPARS